jgi:hypothetical protein
LERVKTKPQNYKFGFIESQEGRLNPHDDLVENLIKENRELACILGASIRTAQESINNQ